MVGHLAITAISIFIICVLIELVRRKVLGRVIDNLIDKIKYEIKCEGKE